VKIASIAIAGLFLAACQSAPVATTGLAATPAGSPDAAESVQLAEGGEDVICRNMKVTGSRFAKRECKTGEAWKKFDAYTNQNAREAADKIQRVGTGSSVGGT
jgi:hypothetical protein